jgi:hypothetical protein
MNDPVIRNSPSITEIPARGIDLRLTLLCFKEDDGIRLSFIYGKKVKTFFQYHVKKSYWAEENLNSMKVNLERGLAPPNGSILLG